MRYLFLLTCLVFFTFTSLHAALATPVAPAAAKAIAPVDLSRGAVEVQLGRKLTFTERVALSIVRKKAKKQAKRQAKSAADGRITDTPALLSMIFGIVGLIGLFVSGYFLLLSIAAVVLGIVGLSNINRNPGYKKGKGFAIAGIAIGGGILFLTLLAVSILLLAFR